MKYTVKTDVNVPTNYVWNIVHKWTVTIMAIMWHFEVISDKFNIESALMWEVPPKQKVVVVVVLVVVIVVMMVMMM
jgi:hypothetical protein